MNSNGIEVEKEGNAVTLKQTARLPGQVEIDIESLRCDGVMRFDGSKPVGEMLFFEIQHTYATAIEGTEA